MWYKKDVLVKNGIHCYLTATGIPLEIVVGSSVGGAGIILTCIGLITVIVCIKHLRRQRHKPKIPKRCVLLVV